MTKFPYVDEYKLFDRAEVRVAEDLLAEYHDFFIYNQSQYAEIFRKVDIDLDEGDDEKTIEMKKLRAEQNSKAASDHFGSLFGSKDFVHVCLLGMRINWYDLQQILLEEFRSKTPPTLSAMNHIAPTLRKLSSTLLFAEYFNDRLERMKKPSENPKNHDHNDKVETTIGWLKTFFVGLVERMCKNGCGEFPEYVKVKNQLAKLKTVEAIQEYIENNLCGC